MVNATLNFTYISRNKTQDLSTLLLESCPSEVPEAPGFGKAHPIQRRVASVLKLSSSSPTASLGLLLADAVWRKGGTTSRVSAAAKSWLSVYTPPSHCLYCWPMQWTSWTRTCLEDVPGPNLSLFIIFFLVVGRGIFHHNKEIWSYVHGGTVSHHNHV